jgi:excisionase family DNA binding protein
MDHPMVTRCPVLKFFNQRTKGVNNMDEFFNAAELATILKVSKWQVYELAKERTRTGEVRKNPIPSLRIGSSVRFLRSDVDGWLASLKPA